MSSIKSIEAYNYNDHPFITVAVEYNDDLTGDIRDDIEPGTGITGLTPRDARRLAVDLLTAADRIDGSETPVRVTPRRRHRMLGVSHYGR